MTKSAFSSDSSTEPLSDSTELNELASRFGQTIEAPAFELTLNENEDTALSSFSPEVIEVITEEEEKVA